MDEAVTTPPLGTPENPIGAGSVGLARAFVALTAESFDRPAAEPEPEQRARRWALRRSR
jgi:hypothetical protein